MLPLTVRRALVFLAAVAALYGGAFAIRSAAGWTGQAQPLDAPPDAAALVAQLVDERVRAQQLSDQLDQAMARSQALEDALAAATSKASHDAKSAQHLANQLDSARTRLEELQRGRSARPVSIVTVPAPAPTAAPMTGGDEDDDSGEHEGDD